MAESKKTKVTDRMIAAALELSRLLTPIIEQELQNLEEADSLEETPHRKRKADTLESHKYPPKKTRIRTRRKKEQEPAPFGVVDRCSPPSVLDSYSQSQLNGRNSDESLENPPKKNKIRIRCKTQQKPAPSGVVDRYSPSHLCERKADKSEKQMTKKRIRTKKKKQQERRNELPSPLETKWETANFNRVSIIGTQDEQRKDTSPIKFSELKVVAIAAKRSDGCMNKEQLSFVHHRVIHALIEHNRNPLKIAQINIGYMVAKDGLLEVHCENELTLTWLQKTVEQLPKRNGDFFCVISLSEPEDESPPEKFQYASIIWQNRYTIMDADRISYLRRSIEIANSIYNAVSKNAEKIDVDKCIWTYEGKFLVRCKNDAIVQWLRNVVGHLTIESGENYFVEIANDQRKKTSVQIRPHDQIRLDPVHCIFFDKDELCEKIDDRSKVVPVKSITPGQPSIPFSMNKMLPVTNKPPPVLYPPNPAYETPRETQCEIINVEHAYITEIHNKPRNEFSPPEDTKREMTKFNHASLGGTQTKLPPSPETQCETTGVNSASITETQNKPRNELSPPQETKREMTNFIYTSNGGAQKKLPSSQETQSEITNVNCASITNTQNKSRNLLSPPQETKQEISNFNNSSDSENQIKQINNAHPAQETICETANLNHASNSGFQNEQRNELPSQQETKWENANFNRVSNSGTQDNKQRKEAPKLKSSELKVVAIAAKRGDGRLTNEQLSFVNHRVILASFEHNRNSLKVAQVNIRYTVAKDGLLEVRYENELTLKWLQKTVQQLPKRNGDFFRVISLPEPENESPLEKFQYAWIVWQNRYSIMDSDRISYVRRSIESAKNVYNANLKNTEKINLDNCIRTRKGKFRVRYRNDAIVQWLRDVVVHLTTESGENYFVETVNDRRKKKFTRIRTHDQIPLDPFDIHELYENNHDESKVVPLKSIIPAQPSIPFSMNKMLPIANELLPVLCPPNPAYEMPRETTNINSAFITKTQNKPRNVLSTPRETKRELANFNHTSFNGRAQKKLPPPQETQSEITNVNLASIANTYNKFQYAWVLWQNRHSIMDSDRILYVWQSIESAKNIYNSNSKNTEKINLDNCIRTRKGKFRVRCGNDAIVQWLRDVVGHITTESGENYLVETVNDRRKKKFTRIRTHDQIPLDPFDKDELYENNHDESKVVPLKSIISAQPSIPFSMNKMVPIANEPLEVLYPPNPAYEMPRGTTNINSAFITKTQNNPRNVLSTLRETKRELANFNHASFNGGAQKKLPPPQIIQTEITNVNCASSTDTQNESRNELAPTQDTKQEIRNFNDTSNSETQIKQRNDAHMPQNFFRVTLPPKPEIESLPEKFHFAWILWQNRFMIMDADRISYLRQNIEKAKNIYNADSRNAEKINLDKCIRTRKGKFRICCKNDAIVQWLHNVVRHLKTESGEDYFIQLLKDQQKNKIARIRTHDQIPLDPDEMEHLKKSIYCARDIYNGIPRNIAKIKLYISKHPGSLHLHIQTTKMDPLVKWAGNVLRELSQKGRNYFLETEQQPRVSGENCFVGSGVKALARTQPVCKEAAIVIIHRKNDECMVGDMSEGLMQSIISAAKTYNSSSSCKIGAIVTICNNGELCVRCESKESLKWLHGSVARLSQESGVEYVVTLISLTGTVETTQESCDGQYVLIHWKSAEKHMDPEMITNLKQEFKRAAVAYNADSSNAQKINMCNFVTVREGKVYVCCETVTITDWLRNIVARLSRENGEKYFMEIRPYAKPIDLNVSIGCGYTEIDEDMCILVMKHIMKELNYYNKSKETKLKFNRLQLESGCLHFNCADEMTVSWLMDEIYNVPKRWVGADLELKKEVSESVKKPVETVFATPGMNLTIAVRCRIGEGLMSDLQLSLVERSVMRALNAHNRNPANEKVIVNGYEAFCGLLHIHCGDEATAAWLKAKVAQMPESWNNAKLLAIPVHHVKTHAYSTIQTVVCIDGKAEDVSKVIARLDSQNEGLNLKNWDIWNYEYLECLQRHTIVFGIPTSDYKELTRRGQKLHFAFGHYKTLAMQEQFDRKQSSANI